MATFLRTVFLAATFGSLATFSFFAFGSLATFSFFSVVSLPRASAASFCARSSLRFTTFRAIDRAILPGWFLTVRGGPLGGRRPQRPSRGKYSDGGSLRTPGVYLWP